MLFFMKFFGSLMMFQGCCSPQHQPLWCLSSSEFIRVKVSQNYVNIFIYSSLKWTQKITFPSHTETGSLNLFCHFLTFPLVVTGRYIILTWKQESIRAVILILADSFCNMATSDFKRQRKKTFLQHSLDIALLC